MTYSSRHEVEEMENMAKNGSEVRERTPLTGESYNMVSDG